jgi:WD40 repeat protein
MLCWDSHKGINKLVNYSSLNQISKTTLEFCVSNNDELVYRPFQNKISVHRIWDGERVSVLSGHYGSVHSCVFNPIKEELYSAGDDTTIIIWSPLFDTEEFLNLEKEVLKKFIFLSADYPLRTRTETRGAMMANKYLNNSSVAICFSFKSCSLKFLSPFQLFD